MDDATLQRDEDAAWRADGERHGWRLPAKAAWPFRLPGVRFIRAAWMDYRASKAASQWASVGIGLGEPAQRDRWLIYAASRGWC